MGRPCWMTIHFWSQKSRIWEFCGHVGCIGFPETRSFFFPSPTVQSVIYLLCSLLLWFSVSVLAQATQFSFCTWD